MDPARLPVPRRGGAVRRLRARLAGLCGCPRRPGAGSPSTPRGACRPLRVWLRRALLRAASWLVSAAAAVPARTEGEGGDLRRLLADVHQRVADAKVEHAAQICRSVASGSPVGFGGGGGAQGAGLGPERRRPVRIFIDGAFDLTHFGHMNAFRQARALGDYLIVGVNSSESVAEAKGLPPVLSDSERQAVVAACRFVDEIVPASPYIMTAEYIKELDEKYGIDFFVHGDDPCFVDGKDVYEAAKLAGKFQTVPRTEGISTTEIVGRLLLLTSDHHESIIEEDEGEAGMFVSQRSKFLVTSQLMRAFSSALPSALPCGAGGQAGPVRRVYVDGAFDMFHAGHTSLLERAKALGDKLIVGVHSDAVVNKHRGSNYPIMAMHERVLGVLGCRHVDDVLLDAPWVITREMVATLQLSVVVRGTVRDCEDAVAGPCDPHAVPVELGIHVQLESQVGLTLDAIVDRLQGRRKEVEVRQAEKQRREGEWYRQKHGL